MIDHVITGVEAGHGVGVPDVDAEDHSPSPYRTLDVVNRTPRSATTLPLSRSKWTLSMSRTLPDPGGNRQECRPIQGLDEGDVVLAGNGGVLGINALRRCHRTHCGCTQRRGARFARLGSIGGSHEAPAEDRAAARISRIEEHIARRQRQPVGLANDGHPVTSTGKDRSRGHRAHDGELLGVLAAEVRTISPRSGKELGDYGGDPVEVPRTMGTLHFQRELPEPAPSWWAATPGTSLRATAQRCTSTPADAAIPASRSRSRGYRSRSRGSSNCSGFTKRLITT